MTNPPTLTPGVCEIPQQQWEVMARMCWECDVVLKKGLQMTLTRRLCDLYFPLTWKERHSETPTAVVNVG